RKTSLLIVYLISILICLSATASTTELISISTTNEASNNNSASASISANCRYVTFSSEASNLVAEDINGVTDIFVRDLLACTTERVSISSIGEEANGVSANPSISGDGRYIVFASDASNLVDSDTNDHTDVFIHDMVAGTTELISVSTLGLQGNLASSKPVVNADGAVIAFNSKADNLVDGDTNTTDDVFVRNLTLGTTTRISISTTGVQSDYDSYGSSINSSGTKVVFNSYAHNLVDGDTNGASDVFIRDLVANTTKMVSLSSNGTLGNGPSYDPSISPDGRYVAFVTSATNLIANDTNGVNDILVRDLLSETTDIVSISTFGIQGDVEARNPCVSLNGRFIAFWSAATNLDSADTNGNFDVFVRDMIVGTTERISISTAGIQAVSRGSGYPSMTPDGRYITFQSGADDLIPGDTNGKYDILLRDRIETPVNTSLIPDSGSIIVDEKVVLTSVYTDHLGADNIKTCYLLINTSLSNSAGYLFYNAVKNKLYLRPSDSTTLIGGYTPGKTQVIDNGFIILNCRTTTIQKVGNTLTINWNVTFKSNFTGSLCNAWMRVTNKAGLVDTWKQMGSFSMVVNPAPVNISLTPNSGTITVDQQTSLASIYSDPAGYANVRSCYLMLNTGATTSGAGYLYYDSVKNLLYLRKTNEAVLMGGFTPGSANVIDNDAVTLYCADTNVQKIGNNVTINWSIALKPYFAGNPCTASMQVTNRTGYADLWEQMGVFAVN
ncbi:MAG: TolB family protein, partial [Armatimonadota bacterium]